jgi:hypothetical protein
MYSIISLTTGAVLWTTDSHADAWYLITHPLLRGKIAFC